MNLLRNSYSYVWCVHHRTNAMSSCHSFLPHGLCPYVCHLYLLAFIVGARDYPQSVAVYYIMLIVIGQLHLQRPCHTERLPLPSLPPSPCMHVSLLYQTNSLEYQLQLQEAVNHRHRLGILIYLNSLLP